MPVTGVVRKAQAGDHGAIAIVVAVAAVMLFGFGAMAVDMGNAWARKRLTQTDADLAALAGAAKLNGTAASAPNAISTAWDYLNKNLPGDDDTGHVANTLETYTNGKEEDGEIWVSTGNTEITVTVQPRKVSFGLASAIGYDSMDIRATATAAIRSPHFDILPLFLNASCSYGSQIIKFGPNGLTQPRVLTADLLALPTDPGNGQGSGSNNGQGPGNSNGGGSGGSGGSGPCSTSQTGDFGLLDSPVQNGAVNSADWLPLNLANGIDHHIELYPHPADLSPNEVCGQNPNNPPISDGIYDDLNPSGYPNCLDIYNGNKPSLLTQGLIAGGFGNLQGGGKVDYTGRLKGDLDSGCSPPLNGNNPTNTPVDNEKINNDTLDCYFATIQGAKQGIGDLSLLDTVPQTTGVLDGSITDTPRFFVVPVLDTNATPQNGWYPIVGFRGAFITNETTALPATTTVGDDNGISYQQGKISSIRVYAFSLDALPAHLTKHSNAGPYLGSGPTVAVLIN